MGGGEIRKHREVLAGTELVAQALCLFGPHFTKARPKRFNQIHLVAMLDHAAAQVMQVFGLSVGPAIGHQLPCTTISRGDSSVTMSKSIALSGQRSSESVA